LEDLGVDGRTIFKRVNRHVRRVRSGVLWVSVEITCGCCVCGDELVGWLRLQVSGGGAKDKASDIQVLCAWCNA
jgi:hypothetical protein